MLSGQRGPRSDALLLLVSRGCSIQEMAAEFDTSEGCIRQTLYRLRKQGENIPTFNAPRRGDSIDPLIAELYAAGTSFDEMAIQLGVTRGFVNSRVRKLRNKGAISGLRPRGIKPGYKYRVSREAALNERLDKELASQYRIEFLSGFRASTWTQRSDYIP